MIQVALSISVYTYLSNNEINLLISHKKIVKNDTKHHHHSRKIYYYLICFKNFNLVII